MCTPVKSEQDCLYSGTGLKNKTFIQQAALLEASTNEQSTLGKSTWGQPYSSWKASQVWLGKQ